MHTHTHTHIHIHTPQRHDQMPEHKAAGWQTPILAEYRRLVSEAEAEARGGKPVELIEVGLVVGWSWWSFGGSCCAVDTPCWTDTVNVCVRTGGALCLLRAGQAGVRGGGHGVGTE
jgi:hypothetical protein